MSPILRRKVRVLARRATAAALIAVSMAAWSAGVRPALAARQDQPVEPERTGIQLDVIVTQSAGESENAETPESRTWRFASMTTSGQHVQVENADARFGATPFRLEDGRISVEYNLRVYSLNEPGPPRRPGPPSNLIIEARADEFLLEDGAPIIVTALTDETGRTVEVTFTATAIDRP